jgi:agmatinase
VIDPQKRWQPLPDKPDYAGFLSYAGLPLAQDPEHLEGVDVAIVGAPTDDLVSDRPGTRYAPRAIRAASCPPGPHLEAGIDALAALRVVDYGDAPVVPADPVRSHDAIRSLVGEVVDGGVLALVLGGDHSITEPCIAAIAKRQGPVGLIHFDTHTDTGREVFGVTHSHGTLMFCCGPCARSRLASSSSAPTSSRFSPRRSPQPTSQRSSPTASFASC